MDSCIDCKVPTTIPSVTRDLGLEGILKLIKFNVGHIIHLEQIKPLKHHYSIEVITGNYLVVTDRTTGHDEVVTLDEFKKKFGQCQWNKLEAIR